VVELLQAKGFGVTIALVEGDDHSVALCADAAGSKVLAKDADMQHNRNFHSNKAKSEALVAAMEAALATAA